MTQTFRKIISVWAVLMLFAMPLIVDAQLVKCGTRGTGYETWTEPGTGREIKNQPKTPCKFEDLFELAYIIVNYLIGMAGLVAMFFIVWGGVQMLLSGGNSKIYDDAKATIFNALLGLVLTLMSYLIIGYVAGLIIPSADPLKDLFNFLSF